jgi:phosphoglycerol transferase MdoB-like AlkP superfamily enzyme
MKNLKQGQRTLWINSAAVRGVIVAICFCIAALVVIHSEAPWGIFIPAAILRGFLIYTAVFAMLFLATSRPATSAVFALCLTLWLMQLSIQKYAYTKQTLHFFDLFVYFQSTAEPYFFVVHYPLLATAFVTSVFALIGILHVLLRKETRVRSRAGASYSAAMLGLSSILGVTYIEEQSTTEKTYRSSYDFYHFSTFFTSMRDGLDLIRQSDKIRRLIQEGPQAGPANLGATPNLVVIMHESTIDPALYKTGKTYAVSRSLYVSQDGATRDLLVETYAGATWLSDYGFNFGISTYFLGSARSYVGILAPPGKRNHSIARVLAERGYGTVSVYPSPRVFAKSGQVYQAMGYERVIDQHDLAATWRDRDHVYYGGVLKDLERRRASGDAKPMYYFVATMATHAPYTDRAFTESRTTEFAPDDPWAEYARRLRLAADDLADFKEQLTRKFPKESFVIAGFGDHQPILTIGLKGIELKKTLPSVLETADVTGLLTFYRIEGIRFEPNLATARSPLEIGHLSTVVLQAAGIPLDAGLQLRADLAEACDGLMLRCTKPGVRDAFVHALEQRAN